MIYFYSLLLGVVQGITEFLPISSSGHLVILHKFFDLRLADNLAFDVSLHLGSLVAIVVFFQKEIKLILLSFFRNIFHGRLFRDSQQNMFWYLILATIPAIISGYFFENIIDVYLRSVFIVIITLIVGALLFLLVEKFSKKELESWQINWWKALIIGFSQAVALIPGVSRSGITIITGMGLKLKRESAARFSFLMAVPVILGSGVKKAIDVLNNGFFDGELLVFAVGFMVSLMVSYFAVKWLIGFLQRHSLHIFAYYRIVLAVVILIIIMLV